jgi:hypothetical protein
MNFNGTQTTADTLTVQNGVLALAGKLKLQSANDGKKLAVAVTFFQDSRVFGADITGAFAAPINDDLGNTYNTQAKVVVVPNQLVDYQIGP